MAARCALRADRTLASLLMAPGVVLVLVVLRLVGGTWAEVLLIEGAGARLAAGPSIDWREW